MTTLGIVASIDRSSSSVRVATLGVDGVASCFRRSEPLPATRPPPRQSRGKTSHRCDLRSDHLFKAVLKAQAGTPFLRSRKLPAAEESRALILQRRRKTQARDTKARSHRYVIGASADLKHRRGLRLSLVCRNAS